MIKHKKDGNNIIILFCLIIFFPFIFTACNYSQDSERTENATIDKKLELKELSKKLVEFTLEGADPEKVIALVRKMNNLSELVIVGKIMSVQTDGLETARSNNYKGYFTVEVESVKRGDYPQSQIKFLFGMFSDQWPVPLYPVHVKTRYRSGDRIKVYLNYFDEFRGYAAPAGFFSMQALN